MGINIKKQVTSFLLFALMMLNMCPIASAADSDALSILCDSQTQIITVEGTLEYGINNRMIAVTVAPAEGGDFVHIAQTDVAFDGTYSYTFPFDGTLGDYTVEIHCGDVEAEADFSFGTEEQILDQINNAETGEEILASIEKFRIALNYENPTYADRLNDEQKLEVFDKLCMEEFSSLSEINDSFEKLAFDIALKYIGIWQNVEALLRENAELLELDFTDFEEVSKPANVLKLFLKGVTSENAKEVFDEAVEKELSRNDDMPSRPSSGGGGGGTVSTTISVQAPAPAVTPAPFKTSFKDLEEVAWAKDAIGYLEEKGIVSGMEKGTFKPMAPVSRSQFIKMLSIAFGFYDENISCSFTDVPKDSWFYSYIGSAVAKGVVLGREDGNFAPDDSITRQDMAVFAYRCSQFNNAGASAVKFSDEGEIAPYALTAVSALSGMGIINGTGNGEFSPKSTATRAQAAKIIYELIQHMNK